MYSDSDRYAGAFGVGTSCLAQDVVPEEKRRSRFWRAEVGLQVPQELEELYLEAPQVLLEALWHLLAAYVVSLRRIKVGSTRKGI